MRKKRHLWPHLFSARTHKSSAYDLSESAEIDLVSALVTPRKLESPLHAMAIDIEVENEHEEVEKASRKVKKRRRKGFLNSEEIVSENPKITRTLSSPAKRPSLFARARNHLRRHRSVPISPSSPSSFLEHMPEPVGFTEHDHRRFSEYRRHFALSMKGKIGEDERDGDLGNAHVESIANQVSMNERFNYLRLSRPFRSEHSELRLLWKPCVIEYLNVALLSQQSFFDDVNLWRELVFDDSASVEAMATYKEFLTHFIAPIVTHAPPAGKRYFSRLYKACIAAKDYPVSEEERAKFQAIMLNNLFLYVLHPIILYLRIPTLDYSDEMLARFEADAWADVDTNDLPPLGDENTMRLLNAIIAKVDVDSLDEVMAELKLEQPRIDALKVAMMDRVVFYMQDQAFNQLFALCNPLVEQNLIKALQRTFQVDKQDTEVAKSLQTLKTEMIKSLLDIPAEEQ